MRSRVKDASYTPLFLVLAVVLTGCGASRNLGTLGAQAPLSAARVRSVFADHNLRPKVVFDSRSAGNAEINRIAPLSGGKASEITRAGLVRLVAERNDHPVTWLSYSLPQVFVWGSVTDARAWVQQWQQRLSKGAGTQVVRVLNVGILVPESANAEPSPLKAALAELAAMK